MTTKSVEYAFEADFRDLNKGVKDLVAGFKEINQAIKDFAKSANNGFSGVGKGVQQTGQQVKTMRQKLTEATNAVGLFAAAISGGLTLALRDAVQSFAKFDASIRQFRAVSGASVQQMEQFKNIAKELGSSTRFTAQQVADAGVELAKLGFTATESSEAITGMIDASVASGESLDTTSEIIASTIRQFGLAAKDSAKVGDLIVAAANKSAIGIQDWGNSMRYLGSAAAASGQPLEDMASLLVILGNNGIKATVAGNGLQNAILRLQAPTEAGAGILEKYGVAVANSDGKMRNLIDIITDLKKAMKNTGAVEAAGELKDLFGEVALNSMQVFFNKSTEEMQNVRKEMRRVRGDAKETADQMRQGLNQSLLELQSAIEGAKLAIGEKLAPTIQALADGINGLVTGFNSLPGPIQSVISHVALLAAGILGAFAGAAGINFVVGQGVDAFDKVDEVVGGRMTGTFSKALGPIKKMTSGLKAVGGQAAALLGFIVLLYKGVKTNFAGMGDIVSDAGRIWSGVFNDLRNSIGLTDETIAGLKQTFKELALGSIDTVITIAAMFERLVSEWMKAVGNISRAAGLAIRGDLKGALSELQNAKTAIESYFETFNLTGANIDRMREKFRNTYLKQFGETADDATESVKKLKKELGNAGGTGEGARKTSGKDAVDRILDEIDARKENIKTQQDQAENAVNLAKATDQTSASVDGLREKIGQTAQAFAADRQGAIRFQDSVSSIGATCARTVRQIIELSGVTKDFKSIAGNMNVVTDFERLISAGYAEKIPASQAQAGDIVTGYRKNEWVGHTGVAVGNGKLVHASSAAGRFRGDQIAAVDTIQSALGNKYGNRSDSEFYALRLLPKAFKDGAKSATDFSKELNEIQKKFAKLELGALFFGRDKLLELKKTLREGTDEYTKAADKITAINTEIKNKSNAIKKLGIKAVEIEAEARKELQKEVTSYYEQSFSQIEERFNSLSSSTLSASKAMQEQIQGFADSTANEGLSEFEKKAKEFIQTELKFVRGIEQGKLAIAEYDAEIANLQRSLSNANINSEDRAKLEERLNKLQKDRTKAVRGVVEQEVRLGQLEESHSESLQNLVDNGYGELIDKVTANKDSMIDFADQVLKSETGLAGLTEGMHLTDEQYSHLQKLLIEGAGMKALKDQAKANTAALNNMVGILYTIGQAARAVGETFSGLGEGFVNFTRGVEDYAGGMASAVNRLLSGDVVGAVIQGGQTYVQGVTGFFEGISRSMGLMTAEDIKNGQAFIESMAKKSAENIAKQRKEQAEKAAAWELKTQKKAWSELAQAAKEHNEFLIEQHEQRLEKQQRLEDYFSGQQGAAQIDRETADFMNLNNVSAADRELIEPIVRKAIEARAGIITEVLKAYSGNITQAQDEIQRRLMDWAIETGEEVSKALSGDPKQVMDARVNALRAARERLYKQDIKQYEEAIKAEQKKLDLINAQIKADEKRISQREEERRKELAQFDAQDKGLFTQLVSGVDYNAAVRAGLADIANPEGVPTGTFSSQSIEEAIKERVALMTLENENKYKLEEIAQQEYLKQQQAIAALQARAAQEALKSEGLTNRQRLELEQMKADAYVSFQEAYRNALNERFDTEIQGIEKTIDANKRQAEAVSEAVEIQQGHIDALTETYNADLAHITSKIDEVIKGNEEWVVSAQELSDGVEGPLKKIIDLYNKATRVASSLSSSGSSGSAASSMYVGTTANQGSSSVTTTSGQSFRTTSEAIAAGAMAQGGIVPDGYPNDSFLARLTSKEMVLPPSLSQFIMNAAKQAKGGMRVGDIYITGDVNNPSQLRKTIIDTLDAYNRRGAGNYYGTTGLL